MVVGMSLSRRAFLARVGVLGAAAGLLGPAALRRPGARAQVRDAAAVLHELARDTFDGLAAFVVPGDDDYSVAQGVTAAGPGAVAAGAADFLMRSADFFVPFPDHYAAPVVQALRQGAAENGFPPESLDVPADIARELDIGLEQLFANDDTLPATMVFALTFNFLATRVNPAAAGGQFLSPFARLSYEEKAAAWELFEQADPDLVAMIDSQLPEPQTESVSGLLRFAAGAAVEFIAFWTYSEGEAYDKTARKLTGTPIGWQLSNYQPSVDGWDDFKGYWKGRKAADR
jgi:hypothetical protein